MDSPLPLARRMLAELLGTSLLVTVVIGSGIAAQRLSPDDVGLQLLENSIATMLGLTVLILMLGPVSGAHFNPVVSVADWWLGRKTGSGLSPREVGAYALAQTVGGVLGALLANAMFDVSQTLSKTDRSEPNLWLGEVVATAGLVALIFALARTHRGALAAPAVGAYIGAAYWFTSSTSFANPAVAVGRMFSDTFAGIAPASLPGFLVAQFVGAAVGVVLILFLYPDVATAADDVVVPKHAQPTERGVFVSDKPSILFACKANAGRSVTGKVLTAHYAGEAVDVFSAGSQPGEHVHPEVAAVLDSLGLSTDDESPKGFDPDGRYTVVITMGCGEACPFYVGARYEDWELDDPKGQDEQTVRRIVTDIDGRVRRLLNDVVPDLQLPPSVFEHAESR